MLKKRIIPCLLLEDNNLIKSVRFSEHRMIGDPITCAKVFNERNADELIFLDILATHKFHDPDYELIAEIAKQCFMPLSIGGGISQIDQVERLFKIGADKIVLNSIMYSDPGLIKHISSKQGSQAIVASIDVLKEGGEYICYSHGGKMRQSISLIKMVQLVQDYGAGEIIINSINNDGTMNGFDQDLIKLVCSYSSIPIIVSGGCGQLEDIYQAFKNGADAISAGSIFHFVGESVISIKEYLKEKGIAVRQ
jgi:imidazole glycerol-phosphate synthase subunit HisF